MADSDLGAVGGAEEVHAEHAVELLRIELVARELCLDAGIVDEDVEPAKGLEDRLEHRLVGIHIRYVRADDQMLSLSMPGRLASRPRRAQRFLRRPLMARKIDRDRRALGGEAFGDRTPDAA